MMAKEMAKASHCDTKGKIVVDCAECQRGGNGDAVCSAGWKIKKLHKGCCFSGVLFEHLEPKQF